jgi:hypothetical protein
MVVGTVWTKLPFANIIVNGGWITKQAYFKNSHLLRKPGDPSTKDTK